MAKGRRRRSSRNLIASELEVLPLMNLFIVLIPMLLMSAVFIHISVIDMSMPGEAEAQETPHEQKPLDLAVRIGEHAYVVSATGFETRTIARGAGAAAEQAAWTRLADTLAEIAAAHPDHHDVRIVAEQTTRYEEIIAVMDVARAAGLPQTALVAAGAAR